MPITITWENLTNAVINGSGFLEKNAGSNTDCADDHFGPGNAGASSVETISSGDFELQCTFGPDPSGRSFIGLQDGAFSLDYQDWQYCWHVSTKNNTVDPHPPDSVFIYDHGAPTTTTYIDGVWHEGDLLRIVCVGGVVKYYLNCLLVYTSPHAPSYPLFASASLACLNTYVAQPQYLTGGETPGSGGGGPSPGPDTGDSCSGDWTIPTPAAFPFPAAGGPQHSYFEEIEPDWGEHSQRFADGEQQSNTIQTARVRRFAVEWEGLTEAQAQALDAYYETCRGWLKFTLTNPQTSEVVTGVRFERYERSPHRKVWSQSRSARLVRYTA